MTSADLTRKERERLRHRQQILDAAQVLFAEHGFHDVSMQQVAAKAEFSIGSLYNFFKNKDDLYKTLIRDLSDRFQRAITDAMDSTDDEVEKLRSYVAAKTRVVRENMDIIRLYLRETSGPGLNIRAGLDDEIRVRRARFLDVLAGTFADGIAKGRFAGIADPHLLAVGIEAVTNTVLIECVEDPLNRSFPEDPDVLLNIFFRGLLVS
jgi:TetR/AcrR family transcriptional regulator